MRGCSSSSAASYCAFEFAANLEKRQLSASTQCQSRRQCQEPSALNRQPSASRRRPPARQSASQPASRIAAAGELMEEQRPSLLQQLPASRSTTTATTTTEATEAAATTHGSLESRFGNFSRPLFFSHSLCELLRAAASRQLPVAIGQQQPRQRQQQHPVKLNNNNFAEATNIGKQPQQQQQTSRIERV